MIEQVILIDKDDNQIGQVEKLYAHQLGLLHRAFSVFIYRHTQSKIEYLLQKRNKNKYHSGGLWTNICCGHPRPDEELEKAVPRRLKEEVGINNNLLEIGKYYYKADVGNNLIEHEIDHVFLGQWGGDQIMVDPNEIEDYRWVSQEDINSELLQDPKKFTAWFQGAYNIANEHTKRI